MPPRLTKDTGHEATQPGVRRLLRAPKTAAVKIGPLKALIPEAWRAKGEGTYWKSHRLKAWL